MTHLERSWGYFREANLIIDNALNRLIPLDNSGIGKAMRYYCTDLPGKRVRPIFFLEVCKLISVNSSEVLDIAASIEMVHASSLIHTDLPFLDRSTLRRDAPVCHAVFGESKALIAGNALIALAFESIANCAGLDREGKVRLSSSLARTIGMNGIAKGQYMLSSSGSDRNSDEICRLRTAMLFEFAHFAAITLATSCSQVAKDALTNFTLHFSLMFQAQDALRTQGASDASTCALVKHHKALSIESLKLFEAKADPLITLVHLISLA